MAEGREATTSDAAIAYPRTRYSVDVMTDRAIKDMRVRLGSGDSCEVKEDFTLPG